MGRKDGSPSPADFETESPANNPKPPTRQSASPSLCLELGKGGGGNGTCVVPIIKAAGGQVGAQSNKGPHLGRIGAHHGLVASRLPPLAFQMKLTR